MVVDIPGIIIEYIICKADTQVLLTNASDEEKYNKVSVIARGFLRPFINTSVEINTLFFCLINQYYTTEYIKEGQVTYTLRRVTHDETCVKNVNFIFSDDCFELWLDKSNEHNGVRLIVRYDD